MLWLLWLLWALVIAGGLTGCVQVLRSSPRQIFLLLVAVALALSLRFGQEPFYGLEYEDAYVYATAARTLEIGEGWRWQVLRVCAVGSLDNCREWESFPGHLLGFPAAVRAVMLVATDTARL